MFNTIGETLNYEATYTGTITDLNGNALGTFSVIGTDVFQIYGRTSATDTGTWNAALITESVHVAAGGHTIDLNLDDNDNSVGQVSILPVGGLGGPYDTPSGYDVSSSFTVYGAFSVDGSPTFDPGPFGISVADVPEPTSLVLLGAPMLALCRMRRART